MAHPDGALDIALQNDAPADPVLRAQIAQFEVDEAAFRLTMERAMDMARAGQGNPAFSSVLKYYGAELNKRRHELLMAAGGRWRNAPSILNTTPTGPPW